MTKMIDPLVRQVRAFCEKRDLLPREGTVLCALSGGRDSMALLHILSRLAEEGGFQVTAAHFNHRLRSTADRDEAFVRNWCREQGIPLTCGAGNVREFARRERLSVEDAARTLRYAFLETAARDMGAVRTATAHHREDNAETVLLHLLRGTGLQGLGGIPPVRGRIVRPLLETSRREIDGYVARHEIPYVEDESNRDAAYIRNRLRLEVLPLLEEISPGCGARIAAAAELLREEDGHLRREAEALVPEAADGAVILPIPVLDRQDTAIRRRLVRTMGRKLGAELTKAQTEAVLSLKSGGCLDLPEGLRAVRKPHRLILEKQAPLPPPLVLHEGEQLWGHWRITVRRCDGPAEEGADRIVLRDTGGELTVAAWDGTGRLAVENGSRTVKRLFADAGVPTERRREYPAVLLDGTLAAVPGVATDRACWPQKDEACLVITWEPCRVEVPE